MTTFDLWLTNQPCGDDTPHPAQRHLEDARATSYQTTGATCHRTIRCTRWRACLAADEDEAHACAADDEASEHAQESWREDSEYFEGDGPL